MGPRPSNVDRGPGCTNHSVKHHEPPEREKEQEKERGARSPPKPRAPCVSAFDSVSRKFTPRANSAGRGNLLRGIHRHRVGSQSAICEGVLNRRKRRSRRQDGSSISNSLLSLSSCSNLPPPPSAHLTRAPEKLGGEAPRLVGPPQALTLGIIPPCVFGKTLPACPRQSVSSSDEAERCQ